VIVKTLRAPPLFHGGARRRWRVENRTDADGVKSLFVDASGKLLASH
jgi:hypothetical protein